MASVNVLNARDESLGHLRSMYGDDAETVIADARYGFISGLLKDVLKKPPIERRTASDKIDKVVVNRWLGIPLFLGIMYAAFQFVFACSPPLMDLLDGAFGWLGEQAGGVSPAWLGSLLADGIVGVWAPYSSSSRPYSSCSLPSPFWRTAATWLALPS